MTKEIKTAVILAAGAGIRMRDFIEKPKGFIEINNEPIIITSVKKLLFQGIGRIIIVTGYNVEYYEELAKIFPQIELVFNSKYLNTGHLYSLYCIKNLIKEDILLLESDIIYESKALEELLKSKSSNAIILSGISGTGDEVFVEDHERLLVKMSKNLKDLGHVYGEYIGISKLSLAILLKIFEIVESDFNTYILESYDTCGISLASQILPVACIKIENLAWGEIDDYDMFKRVVEIFK
jgi:choline kinase